MGRIEEILLIIAIGLLFFGPHKMVDFAKGLGSALNEFKKAANPESQPQPPAAQTVAAAPAAPTRRRSSGGSRKAVSRTKSKRSR